MTPQWQQFRFHTARNWYDGRSVGVSGDVPLRSSVRSLSLTFTYYYALQTQLVRPFAYFVAAPAHSLHLSSDPFTHPYIQTDRQTDYPDRCWRLNYQYILSTTGRSSVGWSVSPSSRRTGPGIASWSRVQCVCSGAHLLGQIYYSANARKRGAMY